MTKELEHIGVDVWMCGTIYVEASSYEEAARIVAERYAGTLGRSQGYDYLDDENLPLDGEDFQSSAVTLYGLANQAELVPANDPVRKAAPALLAALDGLVCNGFTDEELARRWSWSIDAIKAARAAVALAHGEGESK